MGEIATIITALAGAAGTAGTGIAWLAHRTDRRFKTVETKLEACEQREKRQKEATGKHLIVIELLWQVASGALPNANPVMERCKEHLDELRQAAKGSERT